MATSADLSEITGDDTTDLNTSAPLNSLSVPIPDIVEHPLTRACSKWDWLEPTWKSAARHDYEPNETHSTWIGPDSCEGQCQQCQIFLQLFRQFDEIGRERIVVLWRSIEKTSFFRFDPMPFPVDSAIVSAIGSTSNPWGLQGPLPSAESTGSSACMRLARRWLDDCINNHPSCRSPDNPVLPTRVLDLGLDVSIRVSLWETRGRRGRYACLSYCWGKSEFTVTTRDNLKKHMEQGIELKDLPQTFQDAVKFSRELGVRYLWIDALCIIQNEDDHEDWKRECGNMANIYRNSYVTIAAASAKSANGGCFSSPDPGVAIGPVMMRKVPHFPYTPVPEDSADFPILTRAWTFQELLLSHRVIYFGRQEIVWDCIEMCACECGHARGWGHRSAKIDLHSQDDIRSGNALWRRLIDQYAPLQLTCLNDKLPALSGLARAMKGISQENYLAGLWKDTLLFDMCWTASSPKAKQPHQATWRAPSWSWASIDGPIRYETPLWNGKHIKSWKEHALAREAKCTPAGPSLTGEVKDGFLALYGFLIPASVKTGAFHADCSELKSLPLKWFPDRAHEIEEMPVIYLVPIMTVRETLVSFYGLIVKPHGQGTEMMRVGLARLVLQSLQDYFTFFDCVKQLVKII